MRKYEKVISTGTRKNGEKYEVKVLNKGLKKVHIGDNVWLYGRQNYVTGKGLHMVIYGPNRKEYHVWGKDVTDLTKSEDSDHYDNWGYCNRQGNRAIQSKVKIYILTNILDKKENWSFDLSVIPESGYLKVMCENGTVKNIDFNGVFLPQELVSKRHTWKDGQLWNQPAHSTQKFINVIGYRK
jgi:hypothetical protein